MEKEEEVEYEKFRENKFEENLIKPITFENLRKKNQYMKCLLTKINQQKLFEISNGGCFEKCVQVCAYTLRDLEDKKLRPKQKAIRTELLLHSHPSYRYSPISKKAATTEEQCAELIQHYQYAHQKNNR